jgi:CRP/FNR family transcriptional regulator, cyclic AMP receptor protein
MQAEPLQQQILERFFEHCHSRHYSNGEVIISAGDFSSELYFLITGSVSVQYEDSEGHEIILAYLHEGDFFGEIGMFDERRERSAWVRSRDDSEVAHVSYEGLRELVKDSPNLVFEMLAQLAVRLRNTSRKASDLAFTDVAGRVARVLLDLTSQPEAEAHPDGTRLTVTRQELSRLAGCSREMVSRVIRVLEERRIIATEGRSLIVIERGKKI